MKRRTAVFLSAVAVAGWGLVAARSADKPKPAPGGARTPGTTRIGDVRLDLRKREVSFDAEVCLRTGVLEFLLCQWQTKTHESVLHTKAKASRLHAALLMLGLAPGKPARWSGEGQWARFLPPAGPGLKLAFAWKDKAGRRHRAEAGAWLKGAEGKEFTQPKEWTFVGSEVLPDGRYWAELDGEVISVTNFASAVIDVPFKSSNVNELREIYANTEAIPPRGTKVEVIVTVLPKAERAPHARALLEIDRFGRMRVDGRPVTAEQLEEWASEFIERHEHGQVVIRSAGRALVHDVEKAHLHLRLGGVREFAFQRVPPQGEVLPRTAKEAKRHLKGWENKFANARELIHEPGQQAQRVLDQITLELQSTEARKSMLKEYSAHLRQALARYRSTTRPAGKEAPSGRE